MIKRHWMDCLAQNKQLWKERAAKGKITSLFFSHFYESPFYNPLSNKVITQTPAFIMREVV